MEKKDRKPLRLKDFDYSVDGLNLITICTNDMKCCLSSITPVGEGLRALPKIKLTEIGEEVKKTIEFTNNKYNNAKIEKYVIMPNMLVSKNNKMGGHGDPPLQDVIRDIKSYATHKYGSTLWQRSYYDHIIRSEEDYFYHTQYIEENPQKWLIGKDEYYNKTTAFNTLLSAVVLFKDLLKCCRHHRFY